MIASSFRIMIVLSPTCSYDFHLVVSFQPQREQSVQVCWMFESQYLWIPGDILSRWGYKSLFQTKIKSYLSSMASSRLRSTGLSVFAWAPYNLSKTARPLPWDKNLKEANVLSLIFKGVFVRATITTFLEFSNFGMNNRKDIYIIHTDLFKAFDSID